MVRCRGGGSDANSCKTPIAPCRTINAAIAKALPGDDIFITAGVYTNPGAPEVVRVTKNLRLYGGWNSNFGSVINYTILAGAYQRRGLVVPLGVTVWTDHIAIVQGFGQDGGGAYVQGTYGGDHLIIAENRAFRGAGFFIDNPDPAARIWVSDAAIFINQYYQSGGGIFINDGTVYTTNVTVSSNTSINSVDEEHGTPPTFGGGVYLNHGFFWSSNSTFAENTRFDGQIFTQSGAGITNGSNLGLVQIANVLIADGCTGNIGFSTHDLERGNTCQLTGPGDMSNVNPQIFPAAMNGGSTITHALAPASPAIDASDPVYCGGPGADQRGVFRPQGLACDIGAFERKADDPQRAVIGGCDTPDGLCDSRTLLQSILGPGILQVAEEDVESYGAAGDIAPQMRAPLMQKLANAAESLADGRTEAAINQLNAFLDQVQAQRGRKISQSAAENMIGQVQAIIDFLAPVPDP